MAKISSQTFERIMAPAFTTGGPRPKVAPGQDKPIKGVAAVKSVIQDAEPDDVINVIKQPRKTVIILSPFMAEDPAKAPAAQRYAIKAVRDSVKKNEAPLAVHSFYTDLNVKNPIERDIGLLSQLSWMKNADLVAVYVDNGVTPAMQVVLNAAMLKNKKIEYRMIGSGY